MAKQKSVTPKQRPWNCDRKHDDIVDILKPLLESQRKLTGGRHRCAGCAYEAGIREGIRLAQAALTKMMNNAVQVRTYTGVRE